MRRKSPRAGNRRRNILIGIGLFLVCGFISQFFAEPQPPAQPDAPAAQLDVSAPSPTPATILIGTDTPSITATAEQPPTATPLPPTNTPLPPTATPLPPTATPAGDRVALLILENAGQREILGIRNDGANAVEIGGWRLDGSNGDDFCIIPGGTVIQPGEVYQIATGESQPSAPGYKCGEKTIWRNEGETIFLHTPNGILQVDTR